MAEIVDGVYIEHGQFARIVVDDLMVCLWDNPVETAVVNVEAYKDNLTYLCSIRDLAKAITLLAKEKGNG